MIWYFWTNLDQIFIFEVQLQLFLENQINLEFINEIKYLLYSEKNCIIDVAT